ncbi:MAG: DNA repair protein RadC [bacterium]|jgi:DNA repair protein RadC
MSTEGEVYTLPESGGGALCYRICDMPARLRPREAIERQGVENVPDQVILAILLRTGSRGLNVVDLAERILFKYGSLTALSRVTVEELSQDKSFKGLGKVKAQILCSAMDLARRMAEETRDERGVFVRTPEDVADLMREQARGLDHERFWTLNLDTRNRLKGAPREISKGILDASLVHAREVFKSAIQAGGAALVLVHNHPSGDPSPSAEDVKLTRQLVQAGQVIGIKVLDHIIVGRRQGGKSKDYLSLREGGLVTFDE